MDRMISKGNVNQNEIIDAVDIGCQPTYFPSAYDFLSLKFVNDLREQECVNCKIQQISLNEINLLI